MPEPLIFRRGWGSHAPTAANVQSPPPDSQSNDPSARNWPNDVSQAKAESGSATVFLPRRPQTAANGSGTFSILAPVAEASVLDLAKVNQKQGPNVKKMPAMKSTCGCSTGSSFQVLDSENEEASDMIKRSFLITKKNGTAYVRTIIGKEWRFRMCTSTV